jgi:hypothetical protein
MKKEQDTLFEWEGVEPQKKIICYVCERPIKQEPVYIGQGKYRHERCAPGTERWYRSKLARTSTIWNIKDRKETSE